MLSLQMGADADLDDRDYERLLAFRDGLRRFLHWSEQQALQAGVTPAQHQLLLAIRGHPGADSPTIGDVADHLLLKHHSVVGLADRAAAVGLVRRDRDPSDSRIVRLHLTTAGSRTLRRLSDAHLEELTRLSPRVRPIWEDIDGSG